jgi:hypothetical protein
MALFGQDKHEYDRHDYLILIANGPGFRLIFCLHRFHFLRLPGVI